MTQWFAMTNLLFFDQVCSEFLYFNVAYTEQTLIPWMIQMYSVVAICSK